MFIHVHCIQIKTDQGEICESCMNRNFDRKLIEWPHFPVSSQRGDVGGGGGGLPQSAGPCMQIDPDGRQGQTSSPPTSLWLNLTLRSADGREGGRAPLTFAEP